MNNGVTGWVLNSAFLCWLFFSFIYPGKFGFKCLLFSKVLPFTEFPCELMDAKRGQVTSQRLHNESLNLSGIKYKNLWVFCLQLWLMLKQRDFGSAWPPINLCFCFEEQSQLGAQVEKSEVSGEIWSSWSNISHISQGKKTEGAEVMQTSSDRDFLLNKTKQRGVKQLMEAQTHSSPKAGPKQESLFRTADVSYLPAVMFLSLQLEKHPHCSSWWRSRSCLLPRRPLALLLQAL